MATDEQELLDHCALPAGRALRSRRVEMVAALPRTALNKVLRAKLREELRQT